MIRHKHTFLGSYPRYHFSIYAMINSLKWWWEWGGGGFKGLKLFFIIFIPVLKSPTQSKWSLSDYPSTTQTTIWRLLIKEKWPKVDFDSLFSLATQKSDLAPNPREKCRRANWQNRYDKVFISLTNLKSRLKWMCTTLFLVELQHGRNCRPERDQHIGAYTFSCNFHFHFVVSEFQWWIQSDTKRPRVIHSVENCNSISILTFTFPTSIKLLDHFWHFISETWNILTSIRWLYFISHLINWYK